MTMTSKAKASVELEVPFHDVDMLHIVWFGHYYKYMDMARTALMRLHGLDERKLERLGHGLVAVESRFRYSRPLRFGDRFRATAWFADVAETDPRIHLACEIRNLADGRRNARGRTVLVATDDEGRMLDRVPDAILERYRHAPK